jgi:hypothetical protein
MTEWMFFMEGLWWLATNATVPMTVMATSQIASSLINQGSNTHKGVWPCAYHNNKQ